MISTLHFFASRGCVLCHALTKNWICHCSAVALWPHTLSLSLALAQHRHHYAISLIWLDLAIGECSRLVCVCSYIICTLTAFGWRGKGQGCPWTEDSKRRISAEGFIIALGYGQRFSKLYELFFWLKFFNWLTSIFFLQGENHLIPRCFHCFCCFSQRMHSNVITQDSVQSWLEFVCFLIFVTAATRKLDLTVKKKKKTQKIKRLSPRKIILFSNYSSFAESKTTTWFSVFRK